MSIHNPIIEDETGPPNALAPLSAPKLDIKEYRAMIDEETIDPDEAEALLRILWDIAATFARMGFGLDPVQLIFGERLVSAWDQAQEDDDEDGKHDE